MIALPHPFWPLLTLLTCGALVVPAVRARGRVSRVRPLSVLVLAIGADAALALAITLAEARRDGPASDLLSVGPWLPLALPAFGLWFIDATMTTRRGNVAPLVVAFALLGVTPAAQEGAFIRVSGAFASASRTDMWLVALVALSQVVSSIAACGALIRAYRRHCDPFERNQLKFVLVAMVVMYVGSISYWLPAPVWQSLHHGANAVVVSTLAFAAGRTRLPDFNVTLRQMAGHLLVAVPTSLIYVGALVMLVRGLGVTLASPSGLVLAVALGLGAVLVAAYMRSVASVLLERPVRARRREWEARIAALSREASVTRSVRELASAVTRACLGSLDASFVTLLASSDLGRPLRVVDTRGPAPRLGLHVAIASDNPLLAELAAARGVVTPFALSLMAEASEGSATTEFAPILDCTLAPLVSRGVAIGLIAVGPPVNGGSYKLAALEFLAALAARSALSLQNVQLIEQLRDAALTDFTTGLPNHRQLQDVFTDLVGEAGRRVDPLACALIDVDEFQRFNEMYGRPAGDEALAQIAATIATALPSGAAVGRYGGDEFLVLLPRMSRRDASDALVRVGAAVRALTVTPSYPPPGAPQSVTARVTWGLAVYPEDGTSQRALTSVADSRLMQRKFEGRPVSVGVARPASGRLIESDPEKLRIVRGLLDLISEKDPVTAQRSQRVASFALLVADELSLSEQERYELWLGSLLHDLGQVGTPDLILQRAGPMTPEEWDVVRRHAALGEQVVRGMLSSEVVSAVVGCHHERYDGLGYPRGLAGEEIPRMARIVAVADAFAAMVDDRPHAPKMSWPEAMIELGRHAGTQFDPAIVNAFLRAVGQSSVRAAA